MNVSAPGHGCVRDKNADASKNERMLFLRVGNELTLKVKVLHCFLEDNGVKFGGLPALPSIDTWENGGETEACKEKILNAFGVVIERGGVVLSSPEGSAVCDGSRRVKLADCTDEVKQQRIAFVRSVVTTAQKGTNLFRSIANAATL
jgi:hypothetical protein